MRLPGWIAVIATIAVAPRAAGADEPPWAVGVTAAHKADAQTLLEAGNTLFLDKRYGDALEQYRRAVAIWDHPAIRFNIVRCLIQLDRSVEASENLTVALAYGAAPLEEAVYAEALAYEKLLVNQVGDVEITCTQPGAKLTLDVQPLGACPGRELRRVAPGAHQLVATMPGFVPHTSEVDVVGGKKVTVAVTLVRLDKSSRVVHRWPEWIPWVVFGGGVGVAGMGGALELLASSAFQDYDKAVAIDCPVGCRAPQDDARLAGLAAQKRSAEHLNEISVGVLAVGVAATVTGAALLYMNRGRTTFPDAVLPAVMPLPGGGGALSLVGRF